eukprot:g5173.t1
MYSATKTQFSRSSVLTPYAPSCRSQSQFVQVTRLVSHHNFHSTPISRTRRFGRLTTIPILNVATSEPTTTKLKTVYTFSKSLSEGDASMKQLLGGKGANLAEMSSIGLSVPPGFTITTEACNAFHESGRELPDGCWSEVLAALSSIETELGLKFGDANAPLLLSVRSGAAVSMPGMMDTVLNLGMNDAVVEGLAKKAGERFAFDAYRRFLDMFGNVVMGVSHAFFEARLDELKTKRGIQQDTDLTAADLRQLVTEYKDVYIQANTSFPEDPFEQLKASVFAVFDSWESDRCKAYRAVNQLTGFQGTAVNVQTMAFGNMGESSGTGVLFTRNPSTGEKVLYGEYLMNAQGEDVVAGIRTPIQIDEMKKQDLKMYNEIVLNCEILERHYKEMMDIEFTIQEGKLYLLQCRTGKRTGQAALTIAMDLVDEGMISPREAIMKVEATHLDQLLHPQFADEASYRDQVIAKGLPASPGASVGQIVFTAEAAETLHSAGAEVILVRKETSPEDVKGMFSSSGVLTQLGGMTSHAAVVARGWGKTCITGCSSLQINESAKTLQCNGYELTEGDFISINGTTGEVILGQQALKPPEITGQMAQLMQWTDEFRTLGVLANADTPSDAKLARENGAHGIGLCRTEHMFFASEERIASMRRMIVAKDLQTRLEALNQLLPFQQADFEGIFRAMDGFPVTIRLLDPPLHEFLPAGDHEEVLQQLKEQTGQNIDDLEETITRLEELNPMLGFRGCRLGVMYPEIASMQVKAIIQAAIGASKEGVGVNPQIMVPLVGTKAEVENQAKLIRQIADEILQKSGVKLEYQVGTMIEVPRACLLADQIAQVAEFFSFGTNDLTQMSFGYSRDDIGKFLPVYLDKGILQVDPFQVLDAEGVGQLMKIAVEKGRATKPNLKIGICGEQTEAASIGFVHSIGLDYVSCSPFRVPIARLAAAQAAVKASQI